MVRKHNILADALSRRSGCESAYAMTLSPSIVGLIRAAYTHDNLLEMMFSRLSDFTVQVQRCGTVYPDWLVIWRFDRWDRKRQTTTLHMGHGDAVFLSDQNDVVRNGTRGGR